MLAVAGLLLLTAFLYITRPIPELVLTVRPQQFSYTPGEPVAFRVVLASHAKESVTMRFSTLCQLSFRVTEIDGRMVYEAARHNVCPTMMSSLTLQPGEEVERGFAWTQLDDEGERVPSGRTYRIHGALLSDPPVWMASAWAEVAIR